MEFSIRSFFTNRKSVFSAFFVILISFLACNGEDSETELLSGNDIVSFNVSSGDIDYAVTINGANINIVSPFNVVTAENLFIEVLISEGSSISPDPNNITAITNPIQFVVTAENGTQKTYTVTVSREQSPENSIEVVLIKNSITNDGINADINEENHIISKEIPQAWSLTEITVEMEIPDFATITPDPSSIDDFSEPLDFVVTAENGTTRNYQLVLTRVLSSNNTIASVTLKNNVSDELMDADIDQENGVVSKEVPSDWDLTNIAAEIIISEFATIAPDPSTINDYSEPINFVVTAEDGTEKNYMVELSRLLYIDNDFESFTLILEDSELAADIHKENGIVSKRFSPNTDLTQLSVEYLISEGATIVPNPKDITYYSSPVSFVITSESNEEKTYNVVFEHMEEIVNINCDQENVSKWFGGDNRANKVDPDIFFAPRNVGTGQSLTPEADIFISSYSIKFSDYFQYFDDDGIIRIYFGDTTVRLQLRDSEGNILASKDKTFGNPMQLYWQRFELADLDLVLKKDTLYYFTWYLVDGEALGIQTGSSGNNESYSGLCSGQGLSGTSTIREETSLDDWEIWGNHSWYYNFRLEGLK